MKIVIVEDDPVITLLNRRYIEKDERFCVVQTFSAAHPALFWLRSNPVDLIILDVMMPEMNGYEAAKAIRAMNDRPDGKNIPIIAMTANSFAEDVQASLDAGMNAHLSKPIVIEEVIKTILRYVHND